MLNILSIMKLLILVTAYGCCTFRQSTVELTHRLQHLYVLLLITFHFMEIDNECNQL